MPYVLRRPRLHYDRVGSGEPLLFISGFTISAAIFEPLLPRYAKHFECITFDNRGSGRSGAPLRPTSMVELAADAARLLDALGLASAHVYGVSMGGMIAQELAISFPERVRGLILGGTWPGGPRAIRPTLRELSLLGTKSAKSLLQPGRPYLAPALFSADFRRREPERVAELLKLFLRYPPIPQGVIGQWWATVFHDTVSRLGRIRAPTLVLHGERDVMAPSANARMLAERIPDADLQLLAGAGHAYLLEQPERSLQLLLDWHEARGPLLAGSPRGGLAKHLEPLTRQLGLPSGGLRTGASLALLALERLGADAALRRRSR